VSGKASRPAIPWPIIIAGAILIAITTGTRQSLGLFLRPLAATGLGIATVSLALAMGQFFWGLAQPAFGILAVVDAAAQIFEEAVAEDFEADHCGPGTISR